jgi:hypothetical protein
VPAFYGLQHLTHLYLAANFGAALVTGLVDACPALRVWDFARHGSSTANALRPALGFAAFFALVHEHPRIEVLPVALAASKEALDGFETPPAGGPRPSYGPHLHLANVERSDLVQHVVHRCLPPVSQIHPPRSAGRRRTWRHCSDE